MKNNNSLSKYIIVLLSVVVIIQFFLPMIYRVKGTSMEPEYKENDYVIINYYNTHKTYNFGDVIVIDENDEHNKIIKRVIGVAGDHIIIKNNELYINGNKVTEDYVIEKMNTKDMDFFIPENNVFVLGDNRNMSIDSRQIGLIHTKNILGKVIYHF